MAGVGAIAVLGIITVGVLLWQNSSVQGWIFRKSMEQQLATPAEPPAEPRVPYTGPPLDARTISHARDLFVPEKIWETHLIFTEEQWQHLGPNRVAPVYDWLQPDGTPILRNPRASRAGIAGVFGWDFPWSTAKADFGSLQFTNIAVRFKGNGTFLQAMNSYRRPFKLNLDKHVDGQRLAGLDTINLHNLVADKSFLSDTLAYEFFRNAGIPAPRTTFTRVFLSIRERWQRRLLGLYLLVENPDSEWVSEVFPGRKVALFKPVTQRFLEDLGSDWDTYHEVYDPKTDPTDHQRRRLIELCQLVSHSSEETFAARIGEFIDLDQFARFLACTTLLASYDSILDNGQNFLLWHDPETDRFGFSPWDLDHSWGEFPHIGTPGSRVRASILHPWVGEKRFFERIFAVEEFVRLYRHHLEQLLDTQFVPERLEQRIQELAGIVRPAIAEFSAERLSEFEIAIAPAEAPDVQAALTHGPRRNGVHQLNTFIALRAREVRAQLSGESAGVVLSRGR